MQKRKPLDIPNPRTTKNNRPIKHHEDEKPYISRLPDQILLEIFFKQSITSLIQCCRVCKTWRRVLSDPHFTKTLVSQTPSCLLVNGSGSTSPKYPNLHGNFLLDLNHNHVDGVTKFTSFPDAKIVGSCNGFLCMYHDYYTLVSSRFSVSNPMTGEILWVAPTEASFESCGFGYSHISNVYKIVLFQRSVFTVMTVGSGVWRVVEYAADLIGYASIEPDWLYLNGFLHCVCRSRNGTLSILAFDVKSESFHRLSLPEYYFNPVPAFGIVRAELRVLDGRLYVTVTINFFKMVVWVMKDYGIKESWTREFEITDNANKLGVCKLLKYEQGRGCLLLCRHRLYTCTPGTANGLVRVRIDEVPPIEKAWLHVPSFLSLKDVIDHGSVTQY